MYRTRATLAVAAATAALALQAVPAIATGHHVHLGDAPQGSPPRLLLMEGRTINLPDGTELHHVVPRLSGEYWSLVGRGSDGYVLAHIDNRDHLDVYDLRHGERHLLAKTHADFDEGEVITGGMQGRVATWTEDQTEEHGVGTVYDADGNQLSQVSVPGESTMVDFDGAQAVVTGRKTRLWTMGSAPVTIYDGHADLASLAHDVLFVRLRSGRSGPTSLSAPGKPAWTSLFQATGLSADGRLVVGDLRGPTDRIQVRRVGSGIVVADLAVPGHANWQPLALEDDHHVLVQATVHGKGRSLFRCDFHGRCERTWSWLSNSIFAGGHFSGPAFGIDFE